jgi:hypothetical protein
MDALNEAKQLIQDAYYHDRDRADVETAMAAVHAQIAQAEQLKRIADALDIMAGSPLGANRILAPDPQDYYSEDEYNKAAEEYDYHKNSRPGESLGEYKARRAAGYA